MERKKIFWVTGILACNIFVCSCGKSDAALNAVGAETDSIPVETAAAEPEMQTEIDLQADGQTEATVRETEETRVEMIPFEIFAAQEGAETINLVVWNESTGVQKVLETEEPYTKYEMQPGDRIGVNTHSEKEILFGGRIGDFGDNSTSLDIYLGQKWIKDNTISQDYLEIPIEYKETRLILKIDNIDNHQDYRTPAFIIEKVEE